MFLNNIPDMASSSYAHSTKTTTTPLYQPCDFYVNPWEWEAKEHLVTYANMALWETQNYCSGLILKALYYELKS